jgi:dephospho-CoA kinase
MKVIGVTGHPSSGKDTVAEYITAKGFEHYSMGDTIRKDMRVLGLPTDRSSINKYVVERRKKDGVSYPAPEMAEAIKGNAVFSGVRNTAEVNIFKNKFGDNFTLIAVEAPIQTRYEWAKARGRAGDDIAFEQFKKEEEQERSGSEFHQVDMVINSADHLVLNDGTKEHLYTKIDVILNSLN